MVGETCRCVGVSWEVEICWRADEKSECKVWESEVGGTNKKRCKEGGEK